MRQMGSGVRGLGSWWFLAYSSRMYPRVWSPRTTHTRVDGRFIGLGFPRRPSEPPGVARARAMVVTRKLRNPGTIQQHPVASGCLKCSHVELFFGGVQMVRLAPNNHQNHPPGGAVVPSGGQGTRGTRPLGGHCACPDRSAAPPGRVGGDVILVIVRRPGTPPKKSSPCWHAPT